MRIVKAAFSAHSAGKFAAEEKAAECVGYRPNHRSADFGALADFVRDHHQRLRTPSRGYSDDEIRDHPDRSGPHARPVEARDRCAVGTSFGGIPVSVGDFAGFFGPDSRFTCAQHVDGCYDWARTFAFNADTTRLTGGRPSSRLTSLVAPSNFAMSTPVAMPMPSSM
jgi:hypothetical protein